MSSPPRSRASRSSSSLQTQTNTQTQTRAQSVQNTSNVNGTQRPPGTPPPTPRNFLSAQVVRKTPVELVRLENARYARRPITAQINTLEEWGWLLKKEFRGDRWASEPVLARGGTSRWD
ncbi:hypothetical protein F4604DRAFT_1906405 [Suillus subluteus]|nr:hypothetical protein F4604DRAFT_1906405 [Suillus subluteus]